MKRIDIAEWERKEYYELFSQYDEPFFGIVSEIDCTKAYKAAKENNFSFYACYLHKSLVAVNGIEELKYRIDSEGVVLYDQINASPTIGRDNGTFGFGFIPYHEEFSVFNEKLLVEVERVRNIKGLGMNENTMRTDVIHYSSIPWIKFSGLTHARNYKFLDSTPKISFGRAAYTNDRMTMPVSVNVHHALVDGLHVAKYLELFQDLLNNE